MRSRQAATIAPSRRPYSAASALALLSPWYHAIPRVASGPSGWIMPLYKAVGRFCACGGGISASGSVTTSSSHAARHRPASGTSWPFAVSIICDASPVGPPSPPMSVMRTAITLPRRFSSPAGTVYSRSCA